MGIEPTFPYAGGLESPRIGRVSAKRTANTLGHHADPSLLLTQEVEARIKQNDVKPVGRLVLPTPVFPFLVIVRVWKIARKFHCLSPFIHHHTISQVNVKNFFAFYFFDGDLKSMLVNTERPHDCRSVISGVPKSCGQSQFHKSQTGMAKNMPKIIAKPKRVVTTPMIAPTASTFIFVPFVGHFFGFFVVR